MFQKGGVEFKYVELEKDWHWVPLAVFCNKQISEVLSVESKLDYDFVW